MTIQKPTLKVFGWVLILLLALLLSACQSSNQDSPAPAEPVKAAESAAPVEAPAEQAAPSTQAAGQPESSPAEPAAAPVVESSDPAAIQAGWQASPHAATFVVDSAGQNNTCARCHAPIDWQPSMEELPESCFACKFELKAPPPTIPENEWENVPCKVCHKEDKKDVIQPEIVWLEIAPLEEYIAVASPTELCQKCHAPVELAGHGDVLVGGAHAGYECTACHSAHTTISSCVTEACHSDVIEPAEPIPGHDADHQAVTCVACHDGSGMVVGPDAERGMWTTFAVDSTEAGGASYPFSSHNTVLEAKCDRCHFADNPWALSAEVQAP